MGWSVVTQPDGLYSIFSSIVDDIICYDCTEEEVIEEFAMAAYDSAKHSAELMMEMHPKRQRMSWEEMLETIEFVHKRVPDLEQMRKEHGTDNQTNS